MYLLPILLALLVLAIFAVLIQVADVAESKGRLNNEQSARLLIQQRKLLNAKAYVAYRFKR